MASKVKSVFKSLAMRLEVEESDFLLLAYEGMESADDFFFKIPSVVKLEDYLEHDMYPLAAYERFDGTIATFQRVAHDPIALRQWLRSKGAAAIRKLWEVSKSSAKRELDKLTEERAEGEAPRKVTAAVSADLEARATARGLPEVLDTEKPGPWCLAKVVENFRLGGANKHLPWEDYTNEEEELRALRLGMVKKELGFKLTPTADGFKKESDGPKFSHTQVLDLISLQDTLKTRAIAFDFLELGDFDDLMKLLDVFIRRLKQRTPERMRTPTIHEVRMVDRLIFEDVLSSVARGSGTIREGIKFYVFGDGVSHKVWDFLDVQIETMPDRGVERRSGRLPPPSPMVLPEVVMDGGGSGGQGGAAKKPAAACFICGKLRNDHPNKKYCLDPNKSPPRLALLGGGGKGGKGLGKVKKPAKGAISARVPASVPDFMKPHALKTPASTAFPQGQRFCWDRNHPDGDKCKAGTSCTRSHLCPRVLSDGSVCLQDHGAGACTR
jgi:hypothetical protein